MNAAVANGMATNLITSVVGLLTDVTVELVALQDHAAGLGCVAVGLKEFGTARAQGAVGLDLYTADGEFVFIDDPFAHEIVHRFIIGIDHRVYVNLQ